MVHSDATIEKLTSLMSSSKLLVAVQLPSPVWVLDPELTEVVERLDDLPGTSVVMVHADDDTWIVRRIDPGATVADDNGSRCSSSLDMTNRDSTGSARMSCLQRTLRRVQEDLGFDHVVYVGRGAPVIESHPDLDLFNICLPTGLSIDPEDGFTSRGEHDTIERRIHFLCYLTSIRQLSITRAPVY